MAYQLYTKNERGEIVAVTPGIDERVSNLESKNIEVDKYKVDTREQTLTTEQKEQVVKNLDGTFLPLTGGTITGNITFDSTKDSVEIGFPYSDASGALLAFRSKNYSQAAGGFDLIARNDSSVKQLSGRVDGGLQWDNLEVERISSKFFAEAEQENYIRLESGLQIVWGYLSQATTSGQTHTYKVAFIKNPSVACANAAVTSGVGVGIYNASPTSFIYKTTSGTAALRFIAIGPWK